MTNTQYPIKINAELPLKKTEKGFYLFMYRATRIPPHLGLLFNGKQYDITLVGPNLGVCADDFIHLITKKFTKTIFIELELPKNILEMDIERVLLQKTQQHYQVSETISCMAPIKEILGQIYQLDTTSVHFIFDLLPLLESNGLIKNSYHLNLQKNINENIFMLTTYSKEDMVNCIQALNRKNVVC